VAEVNIQTGTIVRELFGQEVPLAFKADAMATTDGSLTGTIMEEGITALSVFKTKAELMVSVLLVWGYMYG
jgi:hypothetical protein